MHWFSKDKIEFCLRRDDDKNFEGKNPIWCDDAWSYFHTQRVKISPMEAWKIFHFESSPLIITQREENIWYFLIFFSNIPPNHGSIVLVDWYFPSNKDEPSSQWRVSENLFTCMIWLKNRWNQYINDEFISLISLSKDILVERYHFHFIQQGSLYEMNKKKTTTTTTTRSMSIFNFIISSKSIQRYLSSISQITMPQLKVPRNPCLWIHLPNLVENESTIFISIISHRNASVESATELLTMNSSS